MSRRRIRRTVRQLMRRVAYYATLESGLAPGALDRARSDLTAWTACLTRPQGPSR